jgi:hypothetical protein
MGDTSRSSDEPPGAQQARWLGVAFCSDAYDLPALLAAIRERSGDVPLVVLAVG